MIRQLLYDLNKIDSDTSYQDQGNNPKCFYSPVQYMGATITDGVLGKEQCFGSSKKNLFKNACGFQVTRSPGQGIGITLCGSRARDEVHHRHLRTDGHQSNVEGFSLAANQASQVANTRSDCTTLNASARGDYFSALLVLDHACFKRPATLTLRAEHLRHQSKVMWSFMGILPVDKLGAVGLFFFFSQT